MRKEVFIFIAIFIIIVATLIIVKAQIGDKILPECRANGVIEVEYTYNTYPTEDNTNYFVILRAGQCVRGYSGHIRGNTNIEGRIEQNIRTEIENRNINFNLNQSRINIITGKGLFTIK